MVKPLKRQSGQAMVEMIVVGVLALVLLFAIIQFALIYNAKTVLNYATFEAARAGAVNHGSPVAMQLALAQKLLAVEPKAAAKDALDIRLTTAQDNIQADINTTTCIQRISPPSRNSYWQDSEESGPNIDGFRYDREIPNDQLMYRPTTLKQGLSIQDANLLKIRVQYCHPMIVPIIPSMIRGLMLQDEYANSKQIEGWQPPQLDTFKQQCYRNNRFPIEAQSVVRMQTSLRNYSADFPLGCSQ